MIIVVIQACCVLVNLSEIIFDIVYKSIVEFFNATMTFKDIQPISFCPIVVSFMDDNEVCSKNAK